MRELQRRGSEESEGRESLKRGGSDERVTKAWE